VKRVLRKPPRKEEARSCTNAGFFLKEKLSRGEAVRQPRLRAVHYYGASLEPGDRLLSDHFFFRTNVYYTTLFDSQAILSIYLWDFASQTQGK